MDAIDFATLAGFAITAFTGFFAIMNPIANLPVFISLVEDADEETKRRIRKKATFVAFIIVCSFIVLGKIIFSLFGLTIPAFKIAGGILIFLAGLDMVRSKQSDKDQKVAELKPDRINESVAISPLATPLMAGPGSIVTGMTLVSGHPWIYMIIAIAMLGIVILLHNLVFSMSKIIVKRLGKNVISVIGKLMGMVIAILGTGMVIQGIQIAFDVLE